MSELIYRCTTFFNFRWKTLLHQKFHLKYDGFQTPVCVRWIRWLVPYTFLYMSRLSFSQLGDDHGYQWTTQKCCPARSHVTGVNVTLAPVHVANKVSSLCKERAVEVIMWKAWPWTIVVAVVRQTFIWAEKTTFLDFEKECARCIRYKR